MTALLLTLFLAHLAPTTWGGMKASTVPVPDPKPIPVEVAE